MSLQQLNKFLWIPINLTDLSCCELNEMSEDILWAKARACQRESTFCEQYIICVQVQHKET